MHLRPLLDIGKFKIKLYIRCLQLGLGRFQAREQHIPDVARGLVEVEAHSLAAEFLGYDVELYAILVNHISDSPPLVHNLTPSIAVEVLRTQLTTRDVPGARVSEGRIRENLRRFFPGLNEFLQSK